MATSSDSRRRLLIELEPELRGWLEQAAEIRHLTIGEYVTEAVHKALRSEGMGEWKLTPEERERTLQALAELERRDQELLERRGGRPFPDSGDLINEERDKRTRQLMNDP